MLKRLKKFFTVTKTVDRIVYLSRDEQSAIIGKALDAAAVSAMRRGAADYLQCMRTAARKQGLPEAITHESGAVYLPVSKNMARKVLGK